METMGSVSWRADGREYLHTINLDMSDSARLKKRSNSVGSRMSAWRE